MWQFYTILVVISLITTSQTSPFQLTEKYLQEFKEGIVNFQKSVDEYQFKHNDDEKYHPETFNETQALIDAEIYDFIIIGGGATGSVLANRLSEIPEWKILLLEAGGYENEYTKIPKFSSDTQFTEYNWNFTTIPQKTWSYGMFNKEGVIASGRGLGGSTIINGMLFTRGNHLDYDHWADLNNTGWCYNDVLPYFKKLEDQHLLKFDKNYHNQGGLLHIENPQHLTKIHEIMFEAGKEFDLDTEIDYNGAKQEGLGLPQLNTKNGHRQSTAEAYLKPILKERKNLKIIPYSYVTEILITPHTKHIEGVKYVHDHQLFIAKTTKEVLLSAGALNTPKLLMLSGIGPKDDLSKHGIECLADLQVGQNLKDHIGYLGLDFYYNQTIDDQDQDEDHQILAYLKDGKGPLSTNGFETIGYLHSGLNKDKRPDLEIFASGRKFSKDSFKHNPFNLREEVVESLWAPLIGHHGINVGIMLTHPKSTGTVTIKSTNPFDYPLIDPNQLSDEDDQDIKTILEGIKKIVKFADTAKFKEHGLLLNQNQLSDCKDYEWGSDDYWKCTIRHLTTSLRHVTGTARMGPKYDQKAVVNDHLQVYGVDGLRVIDTSIIPVTITGHTMAPAIMIGEKGADLVKDYWK